MAEAIYLLCAITSVACMVLLLRGLLRTRVRLLFWSSLCFAGLALNSVLLFLDLAVVGYIDLSLERSAAASLGLASLVFGLVWDA
jgi:hypothetical protein